MHAEAAHGAVSLSFSLMLAPRDAFPGVKDERGMTTEFGGRRKKGKKEEKKAFKIQLL